MRRFQAERGESLLELALWFVGSLGALSIAGYAVYWARADRTPHLTPQQQAYVQAVATQRAVAYIRAVATLEAQRPAPAHAGVAPPPEAPAAPPASAPPAPPPPPPAPAPAATSTPLPDVPPPAPAPTAPPPPPRVKPPMATCVGYMAGITSTGIDACNQVTQDTTWDARVRNCVYDIITGSGTTGPGKADCLGASQAAGDPNLSDCFLGLSGQSLYGRTSCRQYYGSQ